MNTLPAPDVDRVLDRMGSATFVYRNFPRPADVAPPPAEPVEPIEASVAPSASILSLVVYGSPNAAPTAASPTPAPSTIVPTDPFTTRTHVAPASGSTSLADMFRMLSGAANDMAMPGTLSDLRHGLSVPARLTRNSIDQ